MTSFYLTLSSDYGIGQQPGDFTCELSDVLDFTDGWEMALVELTYTGQEFDTIPTEHGYISITSKDKLKYDGDYVAWWSDTFDLHLKIEHKIGRKDTIFKTEVIRLPQQHYSWAFFKHALAEGFKMYSELVTCSFIENDTLLRIKVPYNNRERYLNITLSTEMQYLLGADKSDDFWSTYRDDNITHYDIKIKKAQPKIDNTDTVIVPSCENSAIGYSTYRIATLTRQFWTIEMLKQLFDKYSSKFLGPGSGSAFSYYWIDYRDSQLAPNTFYMYTETRRKKYLTYKQRVAPRIPWFTSNLNINQIGPLKEELKAFNPYLEEGDVYWLVRGTYEYKLCNRINDGRYKLFTLKRQLNNTNYPDVTSLVSQLNTHCLDIFNEIASTLNIAVPDDTGPFTCKNNIVSFTQYSHFDIKCSPFLAKLLHLTLSPEGNLVTQVGTQAVEFGKYKRSHLYVHCDCVRSHYVNSRASSLIRTVPNLAKVDQKQTVTYPDTHYYPLLRTHIAYINMFITDDILKGILRFANSIVYTLHFRKCLN